MPATFGTALTALMLVPAISELYSSVGSASALVALAMSVTSGVVGTTVADRALDGLVFKHGSGAIGAIGVDVLIAISWVAGGPLFTRMAVHRIRNGTRANVL